MSDRRVGYADVFLQCDENIYWLRKIDLFQMAQWNGQFTGNSRATKIKDLEEMLSHAVEVYHELSLNDERVIKEKQFAKLLKNYLQPD